MTEHAVNNGSSICQTAAATHLILTYRDFCPNKTLGFSYSGQRAELEFHLVSDPEPPEIQLLLYVRNISKRQWHVLTYTDPFNNNTDTEVKELPPDEDVFLYPIREFSFGNREELIIYFHFDRDAVMLQAPEVEQEQLKYMWSRLQSLLEDAQFADMRVNGLPAHRAVLAAASGPLHETISALISNNQSSEVFTTHEITVCKTSEHSNVDTENFNTNPMEERPQKDADPKHCDKEVNEAAKTNNDDVSECNSNQRQKIPDIDKSAEDTNESIEERNIQHSADSQENYEIVKKDYSSGIKRDGNMVNKSSEDVNTEAKKVTVNDAETVADKKDTGDKKITLSQLYKLFENQSHEEFSVEEVCSRVNNFLTEHEDDAIEIMERPHPDNYTLDIECDKKRTEMFLKYIYRKSWDHWAFHEDLIMAARRFKLESLETYMEMLICEIIVARTNAIIKEILAVAKLLELYSLKVKAVRWARMCCLDCSPKYVLTMPSNHRYQQQYTFSFNVPNISKLKGDVDSKVFYIRGNALQVIVENQDESIKMYLLKIKEVDMALNIRVVLKKKDNEARVLKRVRRISPTHRSLCPRLASWNLKALAEDECIIDDYIEFLVSVEADDLWLTENI